MLSSFSTCRRLLAVAFFVGSASASHAAGGSLGPISDFMTMDVCTLPDGSIAPGKIPGTADCKTHRDIRPGERPPYVVGNFPAPKSGCAPGPITKINVPIQKGKNTRIVSSYIRSACGEPVAADDDDADRNGASIQWYDGGYGFIMGSYSPVALSSFESDLCAQNPQSSQRFFRGWVIAPSTVPAIGTAGYGVFPSKLNTGDPAKLATACATRYNRGLTTWFTTKFQYKSNLNLVSIVSSHYARSSKSGETPGDAMQVEQTYWTREFGLSRWEKWAREDWVHPRSKVPAPELAAKIAAAGRCSRPALEGVTYNDKLSVSATGPDNKAYSRVIRDAETGETHTWYMTLCEDYTNAAAPSGSTDYLKFVNGLADDLYWK